MKQQKQETLMRSTNCQFELTNDASASFGDFGRRDTGAAWNRYVGTATQLETEFMPEMLRLIRDIERLERLAALRAHPRRPQHAAPYRRTEKRRYVRKRTGSAPSPVPSGRCAV